MLKLPSLFKVSAMISSHGAVINLLVRSMPLQALSSKERNVSMLAPPPVVLPMSSYVGAPLLLSQSTLAMDNWHGSCAKMRE
jgi:hypothetical protein